LAALALERLFALDAGKLVFERAKDGFGFGAATDRSQFGRQLNNAFVANLEHGPPLLMTY